MTQSCLSRGARRPPAAECVRNFATRTTQATEEDKDKAVSAERDTETV